MDFSRAVMMLPADYPGRRSLNDEVHARPPEPLIAPARLSYIALLSPLERRDEEIAAIAGLCQRFDATGPAASANHHSVELGAFRLVWERHAEFTRYTFMAPADPAVAASTPALSLVPPEWLATLQGQTIVATHVLLSPRDGELNHEELAASIFRGNQLVGAKVAGGAAFACTDFRIHEDGFARLFVEDRGLTARQAGRTVQRLLEIDTYRVMALLALPVAQHTSRLLAAREGELTAITGALVGAADEDEPNLLRRLTELEGAVTRDTGASAYRFSAAAAYYDLVQRRIDELREDRVQGLQTFGEFIERRLAPAMATCRSVAARQDALSSRVARATQLLATRVAVTRELQNQAILRAMNRRADIQIRLQSTVEGLSIAAVTYYGVGLVGYLAKLVSAWGIAVSAEIAQGLGIPVIAGLAALGLRRVHRLVARRD